MKGMDLLSVDIRSLVYINDSLCKYYKMLSNGSIRLKLSDNERLYMIIHINDLEELFPENKFIEDEE